MATQYTIDPAHSSVQFSVRHLMVSNVRGSFTGVQGTVTADPAQPERGTVEAEIDVHTIATHDENRDAHLKSPDFFDAERYPKITFRSTKIEKAGANTFRVTGDLTIHGVTKPITLEVEEVTEEAKDPWGNTRIGAAAKGKLKRSDFGLTWNAPLETGGFLIGDDVKLEFELELVRAQSAAA